MLYLHRWGVFFIVLLVEPKNCHFLFLSKERSVRICLIVIGVSSPVFHVGVVPLTYSVHVWAYYGLSLILLRIYPIVDSQIRCQVTCVMLFVEKRKSGLQDDQTSYQQANGKIATYIRFVQSQTTIIQGWKWCEGLGLPRISIMRHLASSHFQEESPRKLASNHTRQTVRSTNT